jgi:flavodoxin
MRVLVVYYSRSGNTRKLAQAVALAGRFDLEELREPRDRSGLLGYLRSGFEATFERRATIAPIELDPAGYDLVAIGTPVWNAALSSPVRTFLEEQRGSIARAAFFATLGGRGVGRAFRQMAEALGRPPVATLALREHEVDGAGVALHVARFVVEIRERVEPKPAPAPAPPEPRPFGPM